VAQISSATRLAEAKKAREILRARPAYANQINGHAMVDNPHHEAFQGILEAERPDAFSLTGPSTIFPITAPWRT
jgi:hypothetical protein